MLREASAVHDSEWVEKTMSVLREKQFEACERRLSTFPSPGLFSPLVTDVQAQALLEHSFYHHEPGNDGLATIADLREKVLRQLPVEALYISAGESALLERLLMENGVVESDDWEEIDAAEALTRRLWCSFTSRGDMWRLSLEQSVQNHLIDALNTASAMKARKALFRYDATIHGLLYIAGFLQSEQPLAFFMNDVMKRKDLLARNIAYRYMKATFEYIADTGKSIVLVHPGLADPSRLITTMGLNGEITLTLDEASLAGGMNGLLPEEAPLHQAMKAALEGHTRPEWEADEAAEDLRFLAKQGVSLATMAEVMASMLCVRPTNGMHTALTNLYNCTPHWIGMTANLRH